jgi:predicted transport protein
MNLQDRLASLTKLAEKLKAEGKNLSEASTKVTFIQPLLEDLGWTVTDPDEVLLEYPVFDGTLLDYALLLDGKPVLYLEAKALRQSLTDPKFIAQTVNYANNDGVRWCVLTNGLVYRIYKSDELAPADKNLLAEADIREATDPDAVPKLSKTLSLLSKTSLVSRTLDEWGERVFVDVAVRVALDELIGAPSPVLVNLIRKSAGEGKLSKKQIKDSLARIAAGPKAPVETLGSPVPGPSKPPQVGEGKQAYALEHHLGGKPLEIVDLFNQVDANLLALGADVSKSYLKYYVNYRRGSRSFCTIKVWHSRLDLFASMSFEEAPALPANKVRDVTSIGHLGLGNVAYRIDGPEDIKNAVTLAAASYSWVAKKP